jgi:hypothetical protein
MGFNSGLKESKKQKYFLNDNCGDVKTKEMKTSVLQDAERKHSNTHGLLFRAMIVIQITPTGVRVLWYDNGRRANKKK